MPEIAWAEFERVELRVGTVTRAAPAAGTRVPAIRLWVDLGPALGVHTSSAQLTAHYGPESLVGRQVVCVVNLAPKRVAGFDSQVLVTGFPDASGAVVLAVPERPVPDGARLF